VLHQQSVQRQLQRGREVGRCFSTFLAPLTVLGAYSRFASVQYPLEVKTRCGCQFRVTDRDELGTVWLIFCREDYSVPPDARLVLDLGANFGAFSAFAARRAPAARIVSLEPFPETFDRLSQHVEMNRLQERVSARRLAVAAESGQRKMDADPGWSSVYRYVVGTSGREPAAQVEIETIAFSELVESVLTEHRADWIDLVKMDIEGCEWEVLPHSLPAVAGRIVRLQVEYHDRGPKDELLSGVVRSGFRLVRDAPAWDNGGIAYFERS
jgi:FkbM family methyltransferase